eukprot:343940-Chlamydomonas_euryale.AAC.4
MPTFWLAGLGFLVCTDLCTPAHTPETPALDTGFCGVHTRTQVNACRALCAMHAAQPRRACHTERLHADRAFTLVRLCSVVGRTLLQRQAIPQAGNAPVIGPLWLFSSCPLRVLARAFGSTLRKVVPRACVRPSAPRVIQT